MNDFEIYSLIIGSLNLILISVGFIFAYLQLRGARTEIRTLNSHHADNHDWNRRNAAQEALRNYNYSLLSSPLQTTFDYLNSADSIPVTQIENKFEENADLQSDLHQLLNYYEGLARGINQGIFDENVVKSARRNAMVRCERSFRNYIEKRRQNVSPLAWVELSHITMKWASEDSNVEVRTLTGKADAAQKYDTGETVR